MFLELSYKLSKWKKLKEKQLFSLSVGIVGMVVDEYKNIGVDELEKIFDILVEIENLDDWQNIKKWFKNLKKERLMLIEMFPDLVNAVFMDVWFEWIKQDMVCLTDISDANDDISYDHDKVGQLSDVESDIEFVDHLNDT